MSSEQYNDICKGEFAEIKDTLKSIDHAIRGNGKVGIVTRLDRVERVLATGSRVFWGIALAVCAGIGKFIWDWAAR